MSNNTHIITIYLTCVSYSLCLDQYMLLCFFSFAVFCKLLPLYQIPFVNKRTADL